MILKDLQFIVIKKMKMEIILNIFIKKEQKIIFKIIYAKKGIL